MSDIAKSRAAAAARFRPYFDLQLRFAAAMAVAGNLPFEHSITVNTNLHRRFGLGRIRDGKVAPEWRSYLLGLGACSSHGERLEATCAFFEECPEERMPPDESVFGCFSFEPPDTCGAIRIHFGNRAADEKSGPLARENVAARRAELREMFSHVKTAHPETALVRGGSWLYRIEAYRRLFPEVYTSSCTPASGLMRFDGTSSWGQFLDRSGHIKSDLRDIFLRNLENLDPSRAETAFPLPAMRAEAPIDFFYDFYRV